MSDAPDPAMGRFMVIQGVRLMGALVALAGIAVLTHRFAMFDGMPEAVGYVLLVIGIADFLVIPQVLARKWRSPRP